MPAGCDLDGKQLSASVFAVPTPSEEQQAQSRPPVGWNRWGFGYGLPFTIAGNRIDLRRGDKLICIGEK